MRQAYRRRPQTFMRRILHWEKSDDRHALLVKEQKWLSLISTADLGTRFYNLTTAAWGSGKAAPGCRWARNRKRAPLTEMTREKIRLALIGHPSYERRRGQKRTEETREKMRQSARKRDNTNMGRPHSEETRMKLAARARARDPSCYARTVATKRAMREGQFG